MKKITFILRPFTVAIIASILLLGCGHYIATFDQFAYAQTTAVKVDVLDLVDLSTEPYTSHQKDADEVLSKMMKAMEYEKHRPKNDITVRMWQKLLDSTKQKGIVGSYLASWKKTGTKSQFLIDEFKPLISEGFDLIAELEAKKIKESDTGILNFLKK